MINIKRSDHYFNINKNFLRIGDPTLGLLYPVVKSKPRVREVSYPPRYSIGF